MKSSPPAPPRLCALAVLGRYSYRLRGGLDVTHHAAGGRRALSAARGAESRTWCHIHDSLKSCLRLAPGEGGRPSRCWVTTAPSVVPATQITLKTEPWPVCARVSLSPWVAALPSQRAMDLSCCLNFRLKY
jgi:hypothetical protein